MKYRVAQKLTLKKLNQEVTVKHVTPYHEEGDPNAVVTVELKSGAIVNVPVAIQDDYLTTDPPKKMRIWPLTRASSK